MSVISYPPKKVTKHPPCPNIDWEFSFSFVDSIFFIFFSPLIQLIAANIDVAFIVQSLNENFNVRRLERYLVMIHESNIKPIVLML